MAGLPDHAPAYVCPWLKESGSRARATTENRSTTTCKSFFAARYFLLEIKKKTQGT